MVTRFLDFFNIYKSPNDSTRRRLFYTNLHALSCETLRVVSSGTSVSHLFVEEAVEQGDDESLEGEEEALHIADERVLDEVVCRRMDLVEETVEAEQRQQHHGRFDRLPATRRRDTVSGVDRGSSTMAALTAFLQRDVVTPSAGSTDVGSPVHAHMHAHAHIHACARARARARVRVH